MKKVKIAVLFLSLFFCTAALQASDLSQTVRGQVVDKITQSPLPGATILLLNQATTVGTACDADGFFKLTNVPLGKQSLVVNYMGYKPSTISNITVNAGKEVVLTIALEENIVQSKEFVVTAKVEKNKALNELATVSARTFSVEETQKYAAAVNDPARMATAFAGVTCTDDGNNRISIRGNAPQGLLWRMEGVEIPNPNHFSNVGTSGGGISILSSQLMANSDFLTGAFPAEYGNALSGVFDIKLRKGNDEKKEYTFQAGVLGLDAAMEGPFKKGYNGSYLVNYRYSTLSVLGKLGVPLGDAITLFQDLSYNISLPTSLAGTFGLFGFGGLSNQKTWSTKDSTKWKENPFKKYDSEFLANTGASGLTHTLILNPQTALRTALVYSGTGNGYHETQLDKEYEKVEQGRQNFVQKKLTLSSTLSHKFNPKSSIKSGIILNQLSYNFKQKYFDYDLKKYVVSLDAKGTAHTLQAFSQFSYKLNEDLTLNPGIHYMRYFENSTQSVEPRLSMRYQLNRKNSVSLGYGMHSQLQPIGVYFAENTDESGVISRPNKNLKLAKSQHLVLSYDLMATEFYHFKVESYYQHLSNVAISTNPNNTVSLINLEDGYYTDSLNSNGIGRNYGLEITAERFLKNNMYFLLSASFFDSKYRAADNRWYNTRFNGNYLVTFTAGKDFPINRHEKSRVFGIGIKTVYCGGLRYTPINQEKSIEKGSAVYEDDKAYTLQNAAYFRTDIKVSLKRNYKRSTGTISFDVQNVSNRKNAGGSYYNPESAKIETWSQAPLIPILSYRIEF